MNKENILYGIIGLLLGGIVGYFGTSSINRNYATASTPSATGAEQMAESSALPADHPSAGASEEKSSATAGEMQNDVTAVIQQARNEPQNFAAQMKAADLFNQIKRYDGALEFYERAQKIKPNDFAALAGLGNATFDLKRYEDAEGWYQAALKIKPNDVKVRSDLGNSYFLREPRELDKAIAEYRKALSDEPRYEQALQNLTAALLAKNDRSGARETFKQLEAVNPNNQALAQFRAQLEQ